MGIKLDPHATQPAGQQLISYAGLEERVEKWDCSPLVRTYVTGRTHLNRKIFLFALSDPENLERAEGIRRVTRESKHSLVRYSTLNEPQVREVDPGALVKKTKPVLLLHCASFGFEAAHVEAGVDFIELLINGTDARIKKLLSSAIVLVMPMVNPDARELALEQWREYQLAPGWPGVGNSYGFIMNRDFHFLSQPENRAVHKVMNDWQPVMTLDTHEDMAFLGAIREEECWTAPFCEPHDPNLAPQILQLVKEYSRVIVEGWRRREFPLWHDENGAFFSYLALDGRFDTHFDLHGVPSLFTESARTPGTCSWEDRIAHKVEASLAFCEKASANHEQLLADQYKYWRQQIEVGSKHPQAYIVRTGDVRDEGAISRLIEILLLHDFQVYATEEPYPAYVIPLGQPDRSAISTMLNIERWNPLPLPAALDVECLRLDALPTDDQQRFRAAPLKLVNEVVKAKAILPSFTSTDRSPFLLRNNESNVRIVNALLKNNIEVRWLLTNERAEHKRGSFMVNDPTGLAHKTVAEMSGSPIGCQVAEKLKKLSLPRIAVYSGQGADERNVTFTGETLWALDFLGFPYVTVDEDAISQGALEHFDVLIMPAGSALEMYNGWNIGVQNYAYPWQVPGQPRGLGETGTQTIADFIKRRGLYIGIGSGGGAFACQEVAGLSDTTIVDHGIGQARVYLKIEMDSPIFYGYEGYRDQNGEWHEGIIPAMYYCDLLWPRMDTYAGPIFRAGEKSKVLATFKGIDFEEWTEYIIKPPTAFTTNNAAIVSQKLGKGSLILFGINLGFRGQWQADYRLLSNAIYSWDLH